MSGLHKDKLLIALILLLAITLLSWLMLYATALKPATLGVLLLVLAFVKVQIIISQYMELKTAVLPVRMAFHAWLIVVSGAIVALYLY